MKAEGLHMSRLQAIRSQLDRIKQDLHNKEQHSWAFVLLGNSEIPAEQLARIQPGDNLYVKRIYLNG